MASLVLDEEQIELIKKARDLLEALIETLDVMSNPSLKEEIRKGEEDARKGRLRDYDEFIRELKSSGEI